MSEREKKKKTKKNDLPMHEDERHRCDSSITLIASPPTHLLFQPPKRWEILDQQQRPPRCNHYFPKLYLLALLHLKVPTLTTTRATAPTNHARLHPDMRRLLM